MSTISQVQRKFVSNLEARMDRAELMVETLASLLTADQKAALGEDAQVMLKLVLQAKQQRDTNKAK